MSKNYSSIHCNPIVSISGRQASNCIIGVSGHIVRVNRRRRGVSELTGTLMTMAITLAAGATVFGYVRSQAKLSELALSQNVGGTLNFLQQRFVIPLVRYTSNSITIYIYNNCKATNQFTQLEAYRPT